ncbi:MAG TPA: hypothetical protein VHL34_15830 [Rhizomicrobium sp.]|jgi:hypothetical protein|nr:hypothetical protein [Rhizomicrobium sp.]
MLEYEGFVYLDTQKTGSTFVLNFLKKHTRGEPLRERKHMPLRTNTRLNKICFVSARDPWEAYVSLFSFGCTNGGKGRMYRVLTDHGHGDLYKDASVSGLRRWLEFVLEPQNAALVSPEVGDFEDMKPGLIGLQSYRFLTLSLMNEGRRQLTRCATRADVMRTYRTHRITSHVLRTEHLTADLAVLTAGPLKPFLSDPDAALQELKSKMRRVNRSQRVDNTASTSFEDVLDDWHGKSAATDDLADLKARVQELEWFLVDTLSEGPSDKDVFFPIRLKRSVAMPLEAVIGTLAEKAPSPSPAKPARTRPPKTQAVPASRAEVLRSEEPRPEVNQSAVSQSEIPQSEVIVVNDVVHPPRASAVVHAAPHNADQRRFWRRQLRGGHWLRRLVGRGAVLLRGESKPPR